MYEQIWFVFWLNAIPFNHIFLELHSNPIYITNQKQIADFHISEKIPIIFWDFQIMRCQAESEKHELDVHSFVTLGYHI